MYRYELERHAVHVNVETNEIAVISVLYKLGPSDPFLNQVPFFFPQLHVLEQLMFMHASLINQLLP